jgi:integrase
MARRRRQKGSGEVFRRGAGWAIRWREGSRRRYRGGFLTVDDARRVLDKVRGEIAQGRAGMPPDMRRVSPLAELAEEWLKRRDLTHRAAKEDRRRWKLHLGPFFGRMKPAEVDHAAIRRFVEGRLAAGLAPGTVGLCIHVFSALLEDLIERKLAPANPCRSLPRSTRALFKSDHDPKDTPFVEKLEDVRRIFLALEEPVSIAYALGAMAGLRTGEIIALRWESVDLAARRMTIRAASDKDTGEERATKDKEVRVVPIQDGLLPVLKAWKLAKGGKGLVIPPLQKTAGHISRDMLWEGLRAALKGLGFPPAVYTPGTPRTLTWYRATRHTFASHWVLAGGSLATLARILGHASVTITERHYVHLRPDAYAERDLGTIALDLTPGATTEPARIGHSLATPAPVDSVST